MSQQINLFNPIFRGQNTYFSAAMMAQALGLILFSAIMFSSYVRYQLDDQTKQAAASSTQLELVRAKLTDITAKLTSYDQVSVTDLAIQGKEAELKSMRHVLDFLDSGELGNTEGYAQYFRSFSRQTIDGVWLTSISIAGAANDISLQGRALRPELVPLYISHLRREPSLRGKSFGGLDMQVPMVDSVASQKEGAAPSTKVHAGYIAFTLQSSGTSASADQTGGKK